MQNKPQYAVEAVDNTLRLLTLLWRDGAVRVSDAATELGVARSTAHRLLRMLVYRGFAVQRDDRSYVPGPALARSVPCTDPAFLRSWLRPAMEQVNRVLDETVHLVVRDRDHVRFVDSIEAAQPLRVGSRAGVRLPAEVTSGGKILLAHLPPPAVRALYAGRADIDPERLERMLARTRRQGYGINSDGTEPGITAVGVCVPDPGGEPFAAVSVSAPTMRFRRARAPEIAAALHEAVDAVVAAWVAPIGWVRS
ncbi:MAG: IclR family transcriptional regulator, acetate operon repressor [Pseudonocardiales bacterium]|nr:IclR family transcriptional regulator, acetate operon repressor [Pseudonocardiales bacterium]